MEEASRFFFILHPSSFSLTRYRLPAFRAPLFAGAKVVVARHAIAFPTNSCSPVQVEKPREWNCRQQHDSEPIRNVQRVPPAPDGIALRKEALTRPMIRVGRHRLRVIEPDAAYSRKLPKPVKV